MGGAHRDDEERDEHLEDGGVVEPPDVVADAANPGGGRDQVPRLERHLGQLRDDLLPVPGGIRLEVVGPSRVEAGRVGLDLEQGVGSLAHELEPASICCRTVRIARVNIVGVRWRVIVVRM